MTTLSVNINKVAVLRNSRGNSEPDPVAATRVAIESGCHGITVHPRPDQRHIRVNDVMRVAALIGTLQVAGTEDAPLDPCAQMKPAKPDIEYNIEGNPFAAPRNDYPGLIELVRAVRPAQATLVPDDDGQLTSDHGFDLERDAGRLAPLVRELKSIGVRVSLFVDAGAQGIERVADIGAERIEIYTGPYAKAFAHGDCARELDACVRSAELAHACGLGVNAGHDLDQNNLGALKAAIPFLAEVSIGHALFADSIYAGLASTVRNYLAILAID